MELLVRIRNKTSPDVYQNCRLTKRGDVIAVRPDGHPWGKRELSNPDWRIIRVPISLAEAGALIDKEPGNPRTNRMLQRRSFYLNVDWSELPAGVKSWILDDTRQEPIRQFTAAAIRSIVAQRTALTDPNVLGPQNENVIG